jgi:hypothetical protein
VLTPLPTKELHANKEEDIDQELLRPYQSAIRQLMYIMLSTQPDIAHAVGVLFHYSSNPTQEHAHVALRTFGHLAGTTEAALVFRKDIENKPMPIHGYTDSDWGGDTDTGRSISSYVFFISNAAFSLFHGQVRGKICHDRNFLNLFLIIFSFFFIALTIHLGRLSFIYSRTSLSKGSLAAFFPQRQHG